MIEQVSYVLDHIPAHRTLTPDAGVWQNAGLLAGAISRLQGFSKPDRRRLLNDALIFVTARKHGHTVLTRNRVDFDFLQQLDPSGRVLFYLV